MVEERRGFVCNDLSPQRNNVFLFATIFHNGGTTFFYLRRSFMAEVHLFLLLYDYLYFRLRQIVRKLRLQVAFAIR